MGEFKYNSDNLMANSNRFRYAYSHSSSFADITGAGSIAGTMIISEGKISTSYANAFDPYDTASSAIAIASSQNTTINTLAETFSPIPAYRNFYQQFSDYSFTNNNICLSSNSEINHLNNFTYTNFNPVPFIF